MHRHLYLKMMRSNLTNNDALFSNFSSVTSQKQRARNNLNQISLADNTVTVPFDNHSSSQLQTYSHNGPDQQGATDYRDRDLERAINASLLDSQQPIPIIRGDGHHSRISGASWQGDNVG